MAYVDARQFDAHAIRQICRTASDSTLQTYSLSLFDSILFYFLAPFLSFVATTRAICHAALENRILARKKSRRE